MKKKNQATLEAGELRERAEARLRSRTERGAAEIPEAEAQRLLHNLAVHEIELELQNEELRAARLETEAGLARYTELFDFAPIGYVTLGVDEVIREVNHAAARLLGIERARLVGKPFRPFIADGDRPIFAELLRRAVASETKEGCDAQLVPLGAERLQARLTAVVLAHAEPTILLAVVDMTERKAKEEQLARTQEALREADRRKDEFLAVLSHELRNPLAPIRSSLFVLARATPGSEQARKAQGIIDRQVTHLSHLVDDLLDVTRITRGKVRLRCERLELGELVRETVLDHHASFEASGVDLDASFAAGEFWVDADPVRLIQALSNLLGNAEKFTPRGGRVAVSVGRAGGDVAVRVRDTGAGIAPHLLQHVFEPFSQAPQAIDRTRGGLGLGLATVKGLIDLHRGSVKIASDGLGRGTELTVTLPLVAPPVAAEAPAPPAALPCRRVLVIEDSPDGAQGLKDALELSGHQVRVAYTGPDGLHEARAFLPEVVICDIGLPGMDGYAVARAFRAEEKLRRIYLVALTGYTQAEDVRNANQAGFDRHVAKPVRLETLDRLLQQLPAPG